MRGHDDLLKPAGIKLDDGLGLLETAGVEVDGRWLSDDRLVTVLGGSAWRVGRSPGAKVLLVVLGAGRIVAGVDVGDGTVIVPGLVRGKRKRWLRTDTCPDGKRILYARG